jgi:multidrug transporter EmrE-like cation transporter
VKTGVAVAYLLLAVVAPIAIARKLRSSEATWRRTSVVSALIVVTVSVLFFPFAALPMVFLRLDGHLIRALGGLG